MLPVSFHAETPLSVRHPTQTLQIRRHLMTVAVAGACLAFAVPVAAQSTWADFLRSGTQTYSEMGFGSSGSPIPDTPPPPTGGDTSTPSVPNAFTATVIPPAQVRLAWQASTDDRGVAGYMIFRNGSLLTTTTATTLQDQNLSPGDNYSYAVRAFDAQGNSSAQTAAVVATMPAEPPNVALEDMPAIPESAMRLTDSKYSGATWAMFMAGGIMAPWTNPGGDWVDRDGTLQGTEPWATASILTKGAEQVLSFDVTELVIRHQTTGERRIPNRGWIVKLDSGRVVGVYYSRESAMAAKRPVLELVTTTGTHRLAAGADAPLSASAKTPNGNIAKTSPIGSGTRLGLWFDLSSIKGDVLNARLLLTSTASQTSGGVGTLGVYPVDLSAAFAPTPIKTGVAALYPGDSGIESHPDVLFVERYQDLNLHERGWWWDGGNAETRNNRSIVGDNDPNDPNYRPLAPGVKAYKMTIPKGGQGGDYGTWRFWTNLGEEPDEIYIRTYARMGTDFDSTMGKFPFGFDGTYHRPKYMGVPVGTRLDYRPLNPVTGRPWARPDGPPSAGNGGAKSNGRNGWSARGLFVTSDCDETNCLSPATNPLTAAGYRGLGFYTYWIDQPQYKGALFPWRNAMLGFVPKNTWFAVDQYLKLNTVNADGSGNFDGILRTWINGRLAYEKTDFRARHAPGNRAAALNVKVDGVWLNFYHGGLDRARSPMTVYFADTVVSKSFIGPATFAPPAGN